MAFRKLNHVQSLITGAIESDTGSQYLFGYRAESGLQWLERTGIKYGPGDQEWRQAEAFVESSVSGTRPVGRTQPRRVEAVRDDWDEGLQSASVQMGSPETSERPRTVTRSNASGDYDMGMASMGDIVGSRGGTQDFSEDDIAAQAATYLQGM